MLFLLLNFSALCEGELIVLGEAQCLGERFKLFTGIDKALGGVGIRAEVECTAAGPGDPIGAQDLLGGAIDQRHIQFNPHAAGGNTLEELCKGSVGDSVDDVIVTALGVPRQKRAGKVGKAHLFKRKLHIHQRMIALHVELGTSLHRGHVGVDRKAAHMQMARRHDDKGKLIHGFLGNAKGHQAVKIGLTAEIEGDPLDGGQRESLGDMLEILRLVPLARTVYGRIPEVVGQADLAKSHLRCVFQNIL